MKKLFFIVITVFILAFNFVIPGFAEEVTDCATGISNVQFSNGYCGFCLDANLHSAGNGDIFSASDNTSVATNNTNNNDVSQKLKVMFTQCFDDIFSLDENGIYRIDKSVADLKLQNAIYHFTDNHWPSGDVKKLVNKVNEYDGPEIPDTGYQITNKDGKIITFYFLVMEPQKEDQQSYFAYKLEVSDGQSHVHNPKEKWESDGENHWHECGCGEKSDFNMHFILGGTCITCGITIDEDEDNSEFPGVNSDSNSNSVITPVPDSDINPGFYPDENLNSNDDNDDKEYSESVTLSPDDNLEIPDTGSESTGLYVYLVAIMGAFALLISFLNRRKKFN